MRKAFSKLNGLVLSGFSIGGARTVDAFSPERTAEKMAEQAAETKRLELEAHKKAVIESMGGPSGGGSGGSGGDSNPERDSDYVSRRFNYERHAAFPWLPEAGREQYTQVGADLWRTPWGRNLSGHAIDRMAEREITAQYVEKIIAYGVKTPHPKPDLEGHNRVYQGHIVGVTYDERIVKTTLKHRKYKP